MIAKSAVTAGARRGGGGALDGTALHLITAQNRGDRGEKAFGVCRHRVGDLIPTVRATRSWSGLSTASCWCTSGSRTGTAGPCSTRPYSRVQSAPCQLDGHRRPRRVLRSWWSRSPPAAPPMRLVCRCCRGAVQRIVPRSPARRLPVACFCATTWPRFSTGWARASRVRSAQHSLRGCAAAGHDVRMSVRIRRSHSTLHDDSDHDGLLGRRS